MNTSPELFQINGLIARGSFLNGMERLACRTGVRFLRFSGERRQPRVTHRGRGAKKIFSSRPFRRALLALLARLKNAKQASKGLRKFVGITDLMHFNGLTDPANAVDFMSSLPSLFLGFFVRKFLSDCRLLRLQSLVKAGSLGLADILIPNACYAGCETSRMYTVSKIFQFQ